MVLPATIIDAPPPPALHPVALPTPKPVDPRKEVIAVGGSYPLSQMREGAHTLPLTADDVERDFPGVYDRMATDPQVRAGTRTLVRSALSTPGQVQPRLPQGHPDYELAVKYAAFLDAVLNRLARPFEQLLDEMATAALRKGHKVAELVYRIDTFDPKVGPQLVLDRIKTKPHGTVAFVQDGYGNDLGVVVRRPGTSTSGTLIGNAIAGQDLIPMSKIAVLTHDGQDGDPRGQSAYRSIYNSWYMLQQILPELLALIARFGQPIVVLTNAPNAGEIGVVNATTGAAETPINPNQALLDVGEGLRAGGVAALSNGQTAALIEPNGQGEVFFKTFDWLMKCIAKGLLWQTLATEEGNHRSGTDAATHQDVLGIAVYFVKTWLAYFVEGQIFARLMEYNYGPESVRYTPIFSLGQTNPQDFAQFAQAVAQLAGQGYWDALKVPTNVGIELDKRLNLPLRNMSNVGPDGIPGTADDPPLPTTPTEQEPPNAAK